MMHFFVGPHYRTFVKRFLIVATVGALLAACAGGRSGILPGTEILENTKATRNKHTLKVVVRIALPKRKNHQHEVRADDASPSPKGMTIAFSGPTTLDATIGLTPDSPKCSASASGTVCTKTILLDRCPSTASCYVGVITTYNEVSCVRGTCRIPPEAHELSANQEIVFSATIGQRNLVQLTLDGIPKAVALVPLPPSTLTGSSSSGFTISKCVTTAQSVSVIGVDVEGNQIIGPDAPISPRLSSNDRTNLAVTKPRRRPFPNTFELVPPPALKSATIPNAGQVVQLMASVMRSLKSGTSVLSSQIDVTFNDDVCGVITEYPIPTSSSAPQQVTKGPDGALWFTEALGNKIGRITTSGSITETAIPTYNSAAVGIANGPDGALWFTEEHGNNIGRITTGGTITNEYPIPTSSSAPYGIAAGPDGALWFTEFYGNETVAGSGAVGRITTDGTITETPTPTNYSGPFGIAAGPDGALWFTESVANKIGRITTSGTITNEYPIPNYGNEPSPWGIAAGPDGAVWFTETYGERIGRITTIGSITTQQVDDYGDEMPWGITVGPEGSMWFTEQFGNNIWQIIAIGAFAREAVVPTKSSFPQGIAEGPDGALWFTEAQGNNIGRLQ